MSDLHFELLKGDIGALMGGGMHPKLPLEKFRGKGGVAGTLPPVALQWAT